MKTALVLILGIITYQDLKDREVYGFVFLILIGLLGVLHYKSVMDIHFFYAVAINFGVIFLVLLGAYIYTIFRIKKPFFSQVFGLGDLLFFLALAIGFPTITFTILLVFSLLFSLLIWGVLKNNSKYNTVPLAGYMSVFIGVVFIVSCITNDLTLYLI
ncbi:hypothetical protein [Aquimarina pacifica]|uniref:hypothetical protein n=1 Tax=Aquimarina pacifica TaxID=1296415 RepID=UPI001268260B|nr:hypothetical protein [Aquimarina pacifica]